MWAAAPGENLTFSIILYPKFIAAASQFALSQAVALGIRDALQPYVNEVAYIKWPNDILVAGKKVCGILIENSLQGSSLSDSVVGIGINVNQTDFNCLPHASSLKVLTDRQYDLNQVLHRVLGCMEGYYLQLLANRAEQVRAAYLQHLYLLNQPATFEADGHTFEGTIRGIDTNGRLLLEGADGITAYGVKEVALVSSDIKA